MRAGNSFFFERKNAIKAIYFALASIHFGRALFFIKFHQSKLIGLAYYIQYKEEKEAKNSIIHKLTMERNEVENVQIS